MDNATLNKEELYQLIRYIETRGFHEPLIITEILDHFASKVEEKLNVFPGMPLEAAMIAAHDDFGPLGFQPIAKTYEASIRKKYKTIYAHHLKRSFANPLHVITGILIAVLFYKGCLWAGANNFNHVFYINDAVLASTLAYFSSLLLLSYKYQLKVRRNPIIRTILSTDVWVGILWGIDPLHHFTYNTPAFTICTLLYAAACFYLAVRHFAISDTLKKGYAESIIVYDYFKSVAG